IWSSNNGGTSWMSKEGDFPDIPVKDILMNPLNNDQVIIATQLGVWATYNFKDDAPTWMQTNNGMSSVKVTSLDLRIADNTILASTFGRGMFTGKFTAATASIDDVLVNNNAVTIYPTVSNGNFTIVAKTKLGVTKVTIFDINGKQVYKRTLDFTTTDKQQVSVNLNTGVYMVNVMDENNRKTSSKIIIEQ
ncbi:MAG: T9SS type A sorting domain-containing protein, partial [Polaribacter sp.]|nr:T9SS type A sorting domain-containing protein [Polaribacter sp.]